MKAYLCNPVKNTNCPGKGSALCMNKSFEGCRWTTERACAAEDRRGGIFEISVPSGSSPGVNGSRGVMPDLSSETVAILRQALPEYFGGAETDEEKALSGLRPMPDIGPQKTIITACGVKTSCRTSFDEYIGSAAKNK